ncbi:hypothetical protein WALSEDRAFT_67758 [Wallemia mellicola CBS 633.66]|uniref:Uncharacterized protein n=2 Tax=Wallemia mellicola TaxID=1708541 RepID=I4YFX7_WALMC|nr:hypothetical protein WALSEDRAFT_67758 [Wallemia mellicola CBS 633.66]TIB72140.1 hypothetical protein E3Q24_01893 [Wallemia mellicola]EIM22869.1 hypothetical protein WALSEDRAFT_67758 [Wallemia mellicola CBS 633.66]TIB85655.1 hypothetical protein E3Q21_01916 [Wallemia mellicola]TIB88860.1 hypothetical protein E3Q20_01909 [Wallemia mellicola]TIC24047.1 hypothetical protein E3Q12_01695 [Wallemia mellicola]|eukprot:XP_006956918.1 hypothetical protein WALSEDRAFT_67758 [Wallemia mellicola CBS 633.66]
MITRITKVNTRYLSTSIRALANKPEDVESHTNSPWQTSIKEGQATKEYPGVKPSNEADKQALGSAAADQVGGQPNGHTSAGETHDVPEPGLKDKFKKALGMSTETESKKGRTYTTLARQFSSTSAANKAPNEPKEETNNEQSGHINHRRASDSQPLHGADATGKPARYSDAIANEEGLHGPARGGYVHALPSAEAESQGKSSAYPSNDSVVTENYPAADLDRVKPSGAAPGSSTVSHQIPESVRESVTRTTDPDALGSSNRLRHGQAPGKDFDGEGSLMNDVPRERVEPNTELGKRGVTLPPPPRTQEELDKLHPGRKNPPK